MIRMAIREMGGPGSAHFQIEAPPLLQGPYGFFQTPNVGYAKEADGPLADAALALGIVMMPEPSMFLPSENQITASVFSLLSFDDVDILRAIARDPAPRPVLDDQKASIRDCINCVAGD